MSGHQAGWSGWAHVSEVREGTYGWGGPGVSGADAVPGDGWDGGAGAQGRGGHPPGKQLDGSAKTREVKLVTVWSAEGRDRDGTPVRDGGSISYSAAIESAAQKDTHETLSAFAARVTREATRRAFDRVARRAVLGDGATWIWNLTDEHVPDAVQIVDRFHAKQHLSETPPSPPSACTRRTTTRRPESSRPAVRWRSGPGASAPGCIGPSPVRTRSSPSAAASSAPASKSSGSAALNGRPDDCSSHNLDPVSVRSRSSAQRDAGVHPRM